MIRVSDKSVWNRFERRLRRPSGRGPGMGRVIRSQHRGRLEDDVYKRADSCQRCPVLRIIK
ncbi:hypothetical protein FFV06_03475 [Salmonella enterica]|nr:hypothetical protein [Salmonella enterica]ECC9439418.1 hypothetical protein [Salmonella enterica subsp. arizonae]EAR3200135.1 hypothetical protein [Salmonella enterica]EAW4069253.1 hypothetical protein [Salmonella enterica]EAW4133493.1 hypothetical protein [Salmonella enterica]